jgi:hypothetical protein
VAHGGGLAGEPEVALQLAGGGHDPVFPLGRFEEIEDFLLAFGEFDLHGCEQCSLEQKRIFDAAARKISGNFLPRCWKVNTTRGDAADGFSGGLAGWAGAGQFLQNHRLP